MPVRKYVMHVLKNVKNTKQRNANIVRKSAVLVLKNVEIWQPNMYSTSTAVFWEETIKISSKKE